MWAFFFLARHSSTKGRSHRTSALLCWAGCWQTCTARTVQRARARSEHWGRRWARARGRMKHVITAEWTGTVSIITWWGYRDVTDGKKVECFPFDTFWRYHAKPHVRRQSKSYYVSTNKENIRLSDAARDGNLPWNYGLSRRGVVDLPNEIWTREDCWRIVNL